MRSRGGTPAAPDRVFVTASTAAGFIAATTTAGIGFALFYIADPDLEIAGEPFEKDARAGCARLVAAADRSGPSDAAGPFCLDCGCWLCRDDPPVRVLFAYALDYSMSVACAICGDCAPGFEDREHAMDCFVVALRGLDPKRPLRSGRRLSSRSKRGGGVTDK